MAVFMEERVFRMHINESSYESLFGILYPVFYNPGLTHPTGFVL